MYMFILLLTELGGNGNEIKNGALWPGDLVKPVYTFYYSDIRPWKDMKDYSAADERLFGKEIAQQICLIDHTYVIFNNNDTPVILKPSIYSALNKLRLYYKSRVRSSPELNETLTAEYSQILIKGYVCYSEETGQIEELLSKSKTENAIKEVFDQIQLIK